MARQSTRNAGYAAPRPRCQKPVAHPLAFLPDLPTPPKSRWRAVCASPLEKSSARGGSDTLRLAAEPHLAGRGDQSISSSWSEPASLSHAPSTQNSDGSIPPQAAKRKTADSQAACPKPGSSAGPLSAHRGRCQFGALHLILEDTLLPVQSSAATNGSNTDRMGRSDRSRLTHEDIL